MWVGSCPELGMGQPEPCIHPLTQARLWGCEEATLQGFEVRQPWHAAYHLCGLGQVTQLSFIIYKMGIMTPPNTQGSCDYRLASDSQRT